MDIYEFVALWEYIGGDKFMEAEKKEIHEWTAMCERYDGGGKGEAGGLTLSEMRQVRIAIPALPRLCIFLLQRQILAADGRGEQRLRGG